MDPVTSAALISGGSNLLSGVFGGSDRFHRGDYRAQIQISNKEARKQAAWNAKHLPKLMVQGAEAAGINPGTLLRSGGTPGASSGATATPTLASSDFVGQAIRDVGNSVAGVFSAKQDEERDKLELEIMREELAQLQNNAKMIEDRDFGYSIPHVTNYTGVTTPKETQTENEQIVQTFETPGGQEVGVEVGPDFDEHISGKVLRILGDAKRVRQLTAHNKKGLGSWKNPHSTGPRRRGRVKGLRGKPKYTPGKNPPLRGWYGPPGSRTGF